MLVLVTASPAFVLDVVHEASVNSNFRHQDINPTDSSIQEDRHKVEQFHFLWSSSKICGTTSQKCGTAPQKVEQVLKARHCSTDCGTVPQFVEQLLLKVTCHFKMWNSVPLFIACFIVVDRQTNYYFK